MQVWILSIQHNDEGRSILGVYASEKLAHQAWVADYGGSEDEEDIWGYDPHEIRAFDVIGL